MWRHYGKKEANMRNALKILAPVSLLALAACAESSDQAASEPENQSVTEAAAPVAAADAAEDSTEAAPGRDLAGLAERPEIPLTLPKMAYAFDYGFRLAGEKIAPLEQKHADMCEALGPYNCQIVSLNTSGEVDEDIHGELQLAVVADRARGFASLLSAAASEAGAESFKANILGEDLSKSIVDTEARVRSRIALRDRLLDVLKSRKGTVEELVEAERGVAQVNEEIDQAQSWLKEQKGRVAYSRMTITYETATPGGSFLAPVNAALGSLGAIFGTLAALLIVLGAIGVPVLAGVLAVRRLRRRLAPALAEG
jgi:hypothetical protein